MRGRLLVEVGVAEAAVSASEVRLAAELEEADEARYDEREEAEHLLERRQPQDEGQEEEQLQLEELQDDQHGDEQLLEAEAS